MKNLNFIFITALMVSCSSAATTEKTSPPEESIKEVVENVVKIENKEVIKDEIETVIVSEEIVEEKVISDETKEGNKPVIDQEEPTLDIPVENFQDYIQWNGFLINHVSSSGKVNYAKIKKDMAQLDAIILQFESNYPTSAWSSQERLAYWINAYNLYTVKFVSINYPISSIKKITAKPWDKKFISLGGETLSLNDIEHKKIRAKYNEPRVHFALNCASESCPILYNKAFTSKKLYSQLTAQTKKFLNDSSKNNFTDPSKIKISSIFDWYKGDFDKKEGSVIAFINKYRTEKLSAPQISYMEYLWGLND